MKSTINVNLDKNANLEIHCKPMHIAENYLVAIQSNIEEYLL